MVRGDEERLVARPFLAWLRSEGWKVSDIKLGNKKGPDIQAVSPGGVRHVFEVKDHRTTSPSGTNPENTDMWTALGQILTRMGDKKARYGVVVPESARSWFERNLSKEVCGLLQLQIFLVPRQRGGIVTRYPELLR